VSVFDIARHLMPPAIGVIVPFTLPPGSIIAENNPVARNANKWIADKEDR